MRVATLQSFNSGLNSILDNQSSVNKTQQQVSSGRRVLTPADDPIASTKILQLQQDIAQRDQYDRNMTAAENRLKLEEATLSSITDNLTRLQELTVNAGGGTLTQTDRQAIGSEINQLEKSLASLFNTRDPNGEFIFAGFKGKNPPFEQQANGRYAYKGDEGQRFLSIGDTTNVATGDSGKSLFIDVRAAKNTFTTQINPLNTGDAQVNAGFVVDEEAYADFYPDDIIITFNQESAISPPGPNYTARRASDNHVIEGKVNVGYTGSKDIVVAGVSMTVYGNPEPGDEVLAKSTPKQSITDTVFRLRQGLDSLEDNPEDSATLDILIEDTLTNLAFAQSSISEVRSQVGARLNVIDNTRNLSDDVKLVSQSVLSELSDVDFAEAVSRLSLQTFLLEAAQQSYTTISRLSLFNQL
ncbi:flagellar hook-associated protein FlgL [Thalassolituus oleivorans]|uniref:flagellar hook-associated protein FlgL n=2 Tax=Thalassolituus oleivorans TaxID=187493 RepID=UPI00042DC032|nr:flagellar hook-associated protein FlgL [Thalassolituus oleivorans]AHK15279.1 flagellar hook protein FlgL [Thalassolituus oleivorans R6-15]MBQ0727304.1 flagellar hook-associated protein FlgL [Thalassolituus oleivorans]|tara:strand:+ start:2045 stop:3283 length:1239 start_codon:yes stop_codon:yes gene_type:complete